MMKNTIDKAIAIAMKTGVVAAGAVRRSGEFLGSTDKSTSPLTRLAERHYIVVPYVGDTEGGVHVTDPLSFGREQDPVAGKLGPPNQITNRQVPRAPKKTVGPSTPCDDVEFVNSNDGETTRRATLL